MTESETKHPSEDKAVAKGTRRKRPMKCSPKQSQTMIHIKPSRSLKGSVTEWSLPFMTIRLKVRLRTPKLQTTTKENPISG